MSELKAFRIIQGDTGGYGVPSYKCDTDGNRLEEYCDIFEVYDKSEADKVIADKDAKILALDEEVFKQKHHAKLFFDERNYAETQLRHHKYKRCLAMAKWCKLEQERIELIECQDITDDEFNKLVKGFYKKWNNRWLKIAEQFKETK